MKKKKYRNTIHQLSFIGSLVDRTPFYKLIVLFILTILISSLLYYFMTEYIDQGIISANGKDLGIFDSIYFSVVTISSLGYGDLHPVGYGRGVAILEVIIGLILIALIVAKIASERESTLIKILYTTEQDKKLKEYCLLIDEYIEKVNYDFKNYSHQKILYSTRKLNDVLAGIIKYIDFQSTFGMLFKQGTKGALRKLAKSLVNCKDTNYHIAGFKYTTKRNLIQLEQSFRKMDTIANIYKKHELDEKTENICDRILEISDIYKKSSSTKNIGSDYTIELNDEFLDRVLEIISKVPRGKWPKHYHKKVARQLHVSNEIAHRAISKLLENNSNP